MTIRMRIGRHRRVRLAERSSCGSCQAYGTTLQGEAQVGGTTLIDCGPKSETLRATQKRLFVGINCINFGSLVAFDWLS